MKKFLVRLVLGIVILIVGLIIFVFVSWDKTYDYPLPEFTVSKDSAVIARGRYLAFGPAHCASCHTPMDMAAAIDSGKQIPLSGGWELSIDPGTFRAPNLTPDKETGIGGFSDGQLARALRHSVKHDGRILFPFMPFQEISDEDLVAIISFLRSQEPVKHEVPKTELTFLGKALMAFGAIKPVQPVNTPPKVVSIDSTAAYGSYIANSVANCVGCHTDRNLKTGEFTGEKFAGGLHLVPDALSKGYGFITPNLTPDDETGIMAAWDQRTFVKRFHEGRVHAGSPMPWGSFSRINETDIKALYKYLHSLKPVQHKIEKWVFAPGERMPE